MMGKTHLAVGIASALMILQPQSSSQLAVAIIGGSLGGVAADIDVKLDFKNQYVARYAWDAVGSEIAALMISIGLLTADWTLRGGICIYILQRRFWALAGLVISMLLVAMGELNKTHRGKHIRCLHCCYHLSELPLFTHVLRGRMRLVSFHILSVIFLTNRKCAFSILLIRKVYALSSATQRKWQTR